MLSTAEAGLLQDLYPSAEPGAAIGARSGSPVSVYGTDTPLIAVEPRRRDSPSSRKNDHSL